MTDGLLPSEVEVVGRTEERPAVVTLRLRFTDPARHAAFRFAPGQFNMLYLHGVGEVPISVSSDPDERRDFAHTVRAVGRVTRPLAGLAPGGRLGLRGPFGRGWPLRRAEGRDLVLITGGLGCAPTVSVINYVMHRRQRFGHVTIMQGVKHSDDLFWRDQYAAWDAQPDTDVWLAADEAGPGWPGHVGLVTALFDRARLRPDTSIAMMCGPEAMMRACVRELLARGFAEDGVWLSLERNMHCAVARCGHCQMGPRFVCRDGPVFAYAEIKELFGVRGF